jgi:prepilin-type N-terminal cleavage/methylation domain-containing protein
MTYSTNAPAQPARARGGFSLVELMVAMTLTTIIGAAMIGLFVTQSRFLEQQQKQSFARGVTRSATNIVMSELRMIDREGGVTAASDSAISLRVPFAMGLVCTATGSQLTLSVLPVDTIMYNSGAASMAGFAYRQADGSYTYVTNATTPGTGSASTCTGVGINVLTSQGGKVRTISTATTVPASAGTVVFMYRNVRYHFGQSAIVPGRRALYRTAGGVDEELVAPFDTSARFNYFVNDASTASTTAPATLSTITGVELVLNGLSEKPNPDGTYTVVPLRTAVFFKNRRN